MWVMPLLHACMEAARRTPEMVDADISRTNATLNTQIAGAQWNPSLSLSPSYSQSRAESNSVVDGPGIIRSQSGALSMGVSKSFATGTSLSLSAGSNGSRSDGAGVLSDEYYSSSVSIGLSQQLLRGANRRINLYALRDAADGELDAQDNFDATLEGRLSDLISRWLGLAQSEASLEQLRRDVQQARDNLRQYEERLKIGLSRELDVLSLRRGVADQEVQLAKSERLYAAQLRQLQLYWPDLQLPERANLLTATTPAPPPPPAFTNSRQGRALLRQLAAANRRVDASRNSALDNLSLNSGISKGGADNAFDGSWSDLDNPNTFNFQVGLSYSHTFGTEANRVGYHQALLAYDQSKLRARISEREWIATDLELRDRFDDAQARIGEQQRLLDAQRAELELTSAQVAAGQATTRDLVDAQQRVSDAVLALYQANLDVLRADLSLRLHENRLLDLLP